MSTEHYQRIPTHGQHGFPSTVVYTGFIAVLFLITYYFYFSIEFNQASLIPAADANWAGFFVKADLA